jgi:hypothetical protein
LRRGWRERSSVREGMQVKEKGGKKRVRKLPVCRSFQQILLMFESVVKVYRPRVWKMDFPSHQQHPPRPHSLENAHRLGPLAAFLTISILLGLTRLSPPSRIAALNARVATSSNRLPVPLPLTATSTSDRLMSCCCERATPRSSRAVSAIRASVDL